MNLKQQAAALGISPQAAEMLENLDIQEALTQRCVDCGAIIARHGNARWRFRRHRIRCETCANAYTRAGYDRFEALFVC